MFQGLTHKLQSSFARLMGKDKLSEDNISEAVREVRMALLEADVSYAVAKKLVKEIKEKALGTDLLRYKEGGKEVSPGQQFIKIVHDELQALMGEGEATLDVKGKPGVIMLCGLQGSGKTTHCVKLARYLVKQQQVRRPLIAACDLQRPAAVEQLKTLGRQAEISVYAVEGSQDPLTVAKQALAYAQEQGYDLLILDTAGRLHIDEELMQQLEKIKNNLDPKEILFVANATTGQDAVNSAAQFNERIGITGTILTMLDGNARAGAAISIKEISGKPLKFEGIGEKIDDIQLFNSASMADRILGMGDTINLVRKVEEHMDKQEADQLEDKIKNATFTYGDYLKQIQMVKKMGSLRSLFSMFPGMSAISSMDLDESQLVRVEAMILSMTPDERVGKKELIPSRRRRISKGSGTTMDDINRLVKSFKQAKQFFKNMPKMKSLEKLMGGAYNGAET